MPLHLTKYYRTNSTSCRLSELDQLYQNTISSLALNFRVEYCNRLLDSLLFDLKNNEDRKGKKKLKKLLKATEQELLDLKNRK